MNNIQLLYYYETQEIEPLIPLVGEWAALNFDHHDPERGMLEEIGEGLCHPTLKREQGIRGMDRPEKFQAALIDGIADVAIYWCHGMYLGAMFEPKKLINFDMLSFDGSERLHLGFLAQRAAAAFLTQTNRGGSIYRDNMLNAWLRLMQFANAHKLQASKCALTTWAKIVSKRNWRTSPVTGSVLATDQAPPTSS